MKRMTPLRIRKPSFRLSFDGNRIISRAERAARSVLMRAGAFIRRRARSSLRKRKRISLPGRPPSSHTGRLRGLILFGVDRRGETVVIGPRGKGDRDQAGETLEHGKTVRAKNRRKRRRQRMRYRARPFMGPALKAEVDSGKLPKLWANSVRT